MDIAQWSPPSLGQIKVNFDVAVRPDFSVGAAVLRDHLGRVVGVKVQKSHVVGPLEGEVFATTLGLEAGKAQGFQDVIIVPLKLLASIPCGGTGGSLEGLRRLFLLSLPLVLVCLSLLKEVIMLKRTILLDGLPL